MEIEKRFVQHCCNVRFQDFHEEDLKVLKNMVLTDLGAIVAGASDQGSTATIEMIKGWGGKEEVSLLVHGGMLPAPNAVFLNSCMGRALDLDDAMIPGMHVGASSVVVALAAAELAGGCSGDQFIAAIGTGQDVAARINFATTYENAEPTWDPTGVCGIFAATIAAGRILHLDPEQMWNALGLVFTQPGGESIQAIVDRTPAVQLFQGSVSRNAIMSVLLARKGFTGPKNFLEGPWGYFRLYSRGQCDADRLLDGLGKRFEIQKTMFKRYPSCGATIGSTDAILQLIEEVNILPKDVARIDIKVLPYTYKMVGSPFEIGETPRMSALFSIRYCVANALLRRGSRLRHFEEKAIRDPKIMELARKIEVTPDPSFDERGRELSKRVEMTLMTRGGEVHRKVVEIPSGFPGNPLRPEDHMERFRDAAAYGAMSLSKERIEKMISTVSGLDSVVDVRSLIPLLSCSG